MPEAVKKTISGDLLALGYALMSVVLFSLIPFLFYKGNAADAPFVFNSVWRFGGFIGIVLFFVAFYYRFIRSHIARKVIYRGLFKWGFVALIMAQFSYTTFAWATAFIDIAIASVLYDTWPIAFVFYLSYLTNRQKKQRGNALKIPLSSYVLMILGLVGVCFTIMSKYGGFDFPSVDYGKFIAGIGLSILSVILVVITAHAFTLSTRLGNMYKKLSYKYKYDKKEIDTYSYYANNEVVLRFPPSVLFSCALWGGATLIVSFLNICFGLLFGKIGIDDLINIEQTLSFYSFAVAISGGVIVAVLATVFWRAANLLTTNPAVNVTGYLTPVFAIFWLYLINAIDVQRFDFLIIGMIIIVVVNVLINIEASIRLGYKTLIIALWAFGTIAYFHIGIQITASIYFNILFIVNTMYILILSFRLDRFVRRTSNEENRALLLLENIDKCIRLDLLEENARQWLQKIDAPKGIGDLIESYKAMKKILFNAKKNISNKETISDIDRIKQIDSTDRIAQIDNAVDTLALSKQQGGNFGELIAMAILGFISIAITLFAYPKDICGVDGFAVKLFAMLLSTIVVFLFANIVDLWIDRDYPIMKKYKNTSKDKWEFGVEFRDTKSRNFEQWISSLICVAIIGIYGYFLWQEWVVVGGEIACKI